MKKKLFLIAALAVAAAVAAWYVLRMDQGDGMAYLTEPVTIGNITRTVNATGEVGAVQLVSVGAQVGGQIKKLHVVLGQDVKKGDLIAEIDSVPQLNQLETDKARLQSYESQLAAKKVALKIAKTKYDREMQLKKRDAASKESLEDAENAYALAKAEVTELESQIRQARIAVNTDEVNLGYTRITAPLRLSEKTSCTLCGDLGELTGGGKKALLCELELELQAGEEADVQAFAKTLAERFHLHEQPRSKLQRARALTQ